MTNDLAEIQPKSKISWYDQVMAKIALTRTVCVWLYWFVVTEEGCLALVVFFTKCYYRLQEVKP